MADSDTDELSLEDSFHQAADHLASLVTADPSSVSDTVKLQLYGLYKQATVGPCSTPRPAFWDRAGRSKWNAWNQLGNMSQGSAMQQYIDTLQQQNPQWQQAAATGAAAGSSKGPPQRHKSGVGGPVFSTLASSHQQQAPGSSSSSSIHELAGQGDLAALQACLDSGTAVDSRDDQDCTALHFAADRGQVEVIKLLLTAGADINAQDVDGQTALHYAGLCGHEAVAALLIAQGADSSIKDSEGQTAQQIAPPDWTCWQQTR